MCCRWCRQLAFVGQGWTPRSSAFVEHSLSFCYIGVVGWSVDEQESKSETVKLESIELHRAIERH